MIRVRQAVSLVQVSSWRTFIHTLQGGGISKVTTNITVPRPLPRAASSTVGVAGGGDAADSCGCCLCAVKGHAQTTHVNIPRPRPVRDFECPCPDRVLPPVVNRHEGPIVISFFVDEVIISIWEEN